MSGSCAHAEAETVPKSTALMQALNSPPFALPDVIATCQVSIVPPLRPWVLGIPIAYADMLIFACNIYGVKS